MDSKQIERTVPCPCTLIEQDESCPVGYPSLLCDACDGKGHVNTMPPREAIERLRAYANGSNDVKFDTYDAADVIGYLEAMDMILAEAVEANARLIAAAPELLSAVKGLLSALVGDEFADDIPAVVEARAAIAKAEGK